MHQFKNIPPADVSRVQAFLENPARPSGTLSIHELQGFLFAVATAPDLISPSAWLPVIGRGQDLAFNDKKEADTITRIIMDLYNTINESAVARSESLPFMCEFRPNVLANFEADAPISLWSRGFATGQSWLEKLWHDFLPKELEDEFLANLVVLTFFSSKDVAAAHYRQFSRGGDVRAQSFELFADSVRDQLPAALRDFANLGRSIYEAAVD